MVEPNIKDSLDKITSNYLIESKGKGGNVYIDKATAKRNALRRKVELEGKITLKGNTYDVKFVSSTKFKKLKTEKKRKANTDAKSDKTLSDRKAKKKTSPLKKSKAKRNKETSGSSSKARSAKKGKASKPKKTNKPATNDAQGVSLKKRIVSRSTSQKLLIKNVSPEIYDKVGQFILKGKANLLQEAINALPKERNMRDKAIIELDRIFKGWRSSENIQNLEEQGSIEGYVWTKPEAEHNKSRIKQLINGIAIYEKIPADDLYVPHDYTDREKNIAKLEKEIAELKSINIKEPIAFIKKIKSPLKIRALRKRLDILKNIQKTESAELEQAEKTQLENNKKLSENREELKIRVSGYISYLYCEIESNDPDRVNQAVAEFKELADQKLIPKDDYFYNFFSGVALLDNNQYDKAFTILLAQTDDNSWAVNLLDKVRPQWQSTTALAKNLENPMLALRIGEEKLYDMIPYLKKEQKDRMLRAIPIPKLKNMLGAENEIMEWDEPKKGLELYDQGKYDEAFKNLFSYGTDEDNDWVKSQLNLARPGWEEKYNNYKSKVEETFKQDPNKEKGLKLYDRRKYKKAFNILFPDNTKEHKVIEEDLDLIRPDWRINYEDSKNLTKDELQSAVDELHEDDV